MTLPSVRRSLGYSLISWIEYFLVHGPGDVAGAPIVLDDEFAGFIATVYSVDANGRRRYDEAFLSRAKGRAKSELAGMLAVAEALAPVRFDHWAQPRETSPWGYHYVPGEPVGAPIRFPFVRCLATEEGQSGNTYDNVSFMIARLTESHGADFPGIDLGRNANTSTRIFLPDGGEIRPSTASSAAKDGGKESFAVFDETHLFVMPELRSMYDMVGRNLTKRKAAEPWGLQTSTMYAPGEMSIAEMTHKAHEDGTARRLLFDYRCGPEVDLDDLDALVAGLREAYGPAADWIDLERIAGKIQDPRTDPGDAARYYLNRPHAGAVDAVDGATWDAAARTDEQLRPGDPITLGFDGSRSRDATALIACRISDGRLFHIRTWVPADYPAGRVPRLEVDRAVSDAFEAYSVGYLFADPYRWQDYLDAWAGRWPKAVVEFPTNVERRMDAAIERFLTALRAGELTHDGHDTLSQHARNAAMAKGKRKPPRESDEGPGLSDRYLRVVKRKDGRLIDAFVAAILAYAARGQALEDGALNLEPMEEPWFVWV
jgi:phage terminase large subunit-like protein